MGVMGTILGFGAGYALGANRRAEPIQRVEGKVREAVVQRLPMALRTVDTDETREVREVMTALPETVTPTTSIKDAARIMADQGIGDVIVVEPGTERVVGIVTDRDIAIRALANGMGPSTEVGEICSGDVVAVPPTATVRTVDRPPQGSIARTRGCVDVLPAYILLHLEQCSEPMPRTDVDQALQNSQTTRSRDIFKSIVNSYLKDGDPVGSRSLSRLLPLVLSPATIRNVMRDLEHLGLIYAPHISAGRLPTQGGLRFFVDAFMELGDLSDEERRIVEAQVRASGSGASLEHMLTEASQMLSGMSRGAGLVLTAKNEVALKHIEFIQLEPSRALAVLVSQNGDVENRIVELPAGTTPSQLQEAPPRFGVFRM